MSTAKIRVKRVGDKFISDRGIEGYVKKDAHGREALFHANKKFWKWLGPEKKNDTVNMKAGDTVRIPPTPAPQVVVHNTPTLPTRKNSYFKRFAITGIIATVLFLVVASFSIYVSANSANNTKANNKTTKKEKEPAATFSKNENVAMLVSSPSQRLKIEYTITKTKDSFGRSAVKLDIEIKGMETGSFDLMLKNNGFEQKVNEMGHIIGHETNKRYRTFECSTNSHTGVFSWGENTLTIEEVTTGRIIDKKVVMIKKEAGEK